MTKWLLAAALLLLLCLPLRLTWPREAQQANWGTGSCSYAATVAVLRDKGYTSEAAYVRKHYEGAAGPGNIHGALQTVHVSHQIGYTVAFLEEHVGWGEPCVVGIRTPGQCVPYARGNSGHSVVLFYFGPDQVGFYDNNHTSANRIRFVSRQVFLNEWLHFAVAIQ